MESPCKPGRESARIIDILREKKACHGRSSGIFDSWEESDVDTPVERVCQA
jgi:hypothetical protein